jgi:pectate lyase
MKSYLILLTLFVLFILACSGHIPDVTGWASLGNGTSGGAGGDTVLVENRTELQEALAIKKPAIIIIRDTIDLLKGERLDVASDDKSIIGAGHNAMIRYGGLKISGRNIIIRNLSIGDSYQDGHWDGKGDPHADCLTLTGRNIWIDHCELFKGFDGLLDLSADNNVSADLVTISWTHFRNHNKVMLVGSSDNQISGRGHLRVTMHHCWFDGASVFFDSKDNKYYRLTQRMPRVRFGDVHLYNNYYEETMDYCIAARLESDVVVENCFFRNLKNPHIIEDQGKGIDDPDLVAMGNVYENVKGRHETNGDAFNPSDYYAYQADPVSGVPAIVMNNAGKLNRIENNPPVAQNDTVTAVGEELVVNVLKNDTDPDGDSIRISCVIGQPAGKYIIKPNTLLYYPPAEKPDRDSIEYEIIDFQGGFARARVILCHE